MISEKIKNAAEKAMPKEQRFIERIRSFFGKRSHLIIVSGIAAVALLYPIYGFTTQNINDRYNVLLLILGFVHVTAAGVFFSNINKFSMKKYACAVSVCSVVMYLVTVTLGVLAGMDPSDPMQVIPGWTGSVLWGIPICATVIALSVLLAYFTVRSMNKE